MGNNENLESKRWIIAIAAIVMQLCLGTVYAWSVFKKPLISTYGWGETQTQLAFIIFMFTVGCAAAFGGTLVDKKGPKFVASVGGILFALGTLLSGVADHVGNIYILYLGYGLIGGLGNGFCYVTPIATLIRWFPDKRGMVTGLAVMGFGLGANVLGGNVTPKYVPNFRWDEKTKYRLEDFLKAAEAMMGRRGRKLTADMIARIKVIYSSEPATERRGS